ncbi:MAG: ABC-F family ATP-binding cassette domain-containing protein [Chloroflexi bacterium]|nr:ABC-F family ATP-binding cassette domain-containing protein [Chloroflexota bacterium]
MIVVENLTKTFGGRNLLSSVSFTVSTGEKVGVVGPNGAGKTTLLKMIAGDEPVSAGQVNLSEGELAYLHQEADVDLGRSLREEMWTALPLLTSLRDRIAVLEQGLSTGEGNLEQLASDLDESHDRFRTLGGHSVDSSIARVTTGLGFSSSDLNKPCGDFSGGWRMRISLAKILLRREAHLLLDEPTNHLDRASKNWLSQELAEYPGAVLMVTHDGEFLDRVATRVLNVEQGEVKSYPGNYTEYLRGKAARQAQLDVQADRQEREIARQEQFIDRFRSKATKARQVQSRVKALDRIERVERMTVSKAAKFQIRSSGRVERVVMNANSISHDWEDSPALLDVSLEVERGQKIALIGHNGGGKSTFLRILAGEVKPSEGTVNWSEKALRGYYAQHQDESLDREATVLEAVRQSAMDQPDGVLRGILGRFLFTADDVYKSIRMLSGGEKSRVALAKFLVQPSNVLLLDEPTNHLDAATRDELLDALGSYDGTIICASHDPAIVDEIATHVYTVENGEIALTDVRR